MVINVESMSQVKTIALVAHDHRKKTLLSWVERNWEILIKHNLVCTGTTGKLVEKLMRERIEKRGEGELHIRKFKSGPLGGDQQLGALISEGKVDIFIFFWDPMSAQPHDVDVKALLRIAVLYNIPTASNEASADFLIASDWFDQPYRPSEPDLSHYLNRSLNG